MQEREREKECEKTAERETGIYLLVVKRNNALDQMTGRQKE